MAVGPEMDEEEELGVEGSDFCWFSPWLLVCSFFSVSLVFASRTLVVSMWLVRWVAMRNAKDVTIPLLSSLLSGLFVSCFLVHLEWSCSRVLEGKVLVLWTRLVCRAFERLALPGLSSSREFCVEVQSVHLNVSRLCGNAHKSLWQISILLRYFLPQVTRFSTSVTTDAAFSVFSPQSVHVDIQAETTWTLFRRRLMQFQSCSKGERQEGRSSSPASHSKAKRTDGEGQKISQGSGNKEESSLDKREIPCRFKFCKNPS